MDASHERSGYKRSMSLALFEADTGRAAGSYNFFDCWPTKWKLSGFDGTSSNVMTEQVEMVTESLDYTP